jgi:hypothetical protein
MTNKCMDTRQAFGAPAMQGLAGHWQHRSVLSTTNTTVLSTFQLADLRSVAVEPNAIVGNFWQF